MVAGEARRGRFSIVTDLMYTKLSLGSATPRGIVANRVDVISQTFAGLLAAGYALVDTPQTTIDLVAGIRGWSARTEIAFSGGALSSINASDGVVWADGMAGFRAKHFLSEAVFLSGWGLAGAGAARLDWDLGATIGYRFSEYFSAIAGYRALGVDYRRGGFVFDVMQHGPIMGVVAHF